MKGTYTLLVELQEPVTVTVGALGAHTFPAGGYAYTGSAFGPGGFSRVDRHRAVASGERDVRHWHVDYVLGVEESSIVEVVYSPDVDVECAVCAALPSGPVPGFGSSDCDCDSHLAFEVGLERLLDMVEATHETANGEKSV